MTLKNICVALATAAMAGPLAVLAQTGSVTMEAESMSLSSYVVENGNRIKLSRTSGTATRGFTGASGTYDIKVNIITENDGRPTLELHRGSTRLHTYTYPLTSSVTSGSYTVRNIALKNGEAIKLVGRANGDAWARVDSIQFIPVATSTQSTPSTGDSTGGSMTIEAESMSRSSYAIENGTRIKLTASTGSASKSFTGASGTYNVQVYVIAETDGQPKLELHRNSTRLHTYTYPLSNSSPSYTVSNVTLNSGDTLKLVGHANGDAWARVDKIVLTPVSTSSPTTSEPTPTSPTPDTSACANPPGGYEGFGKSTTGGAGKPIYRVKNRNNSGAGSLRDALSQGNRCVVFDVGGTINLSSNLLVRGANVTVDGLTAPSPGITLKGATLVLQGSSGASNVVVRGIRHRAAPAGADGMRVYKTSNVVFDRVSVSGFGDGAIDVTESARNVTIQYSIIGAGVSSHNFASLIKYNTTRVSVLNNLYIDVDDRNPYCGRADNASSPLSEVVCDVRNNIIWNYRYYGTAIRAYGTANVVNNYYATSRGTEARTIYNEKGSIAHISGNVSKNGWHINGSNRSTPYPADASSTLDAVSGAKRVIAKAGARGPKFGLDSTDAAYLGKVSVQ